MDQINPMNHIHSQSIENLQSLTQSDQIGDTSEEEKEGFSNVFNQALHSLEQNQIDANQAVESLINGTADDLHSVMIETTEAQLSLEVAVQLRNRMLESYNEIQNMQF